MSLTEVIKPLPLVRMDEDGRPLVSLEEDFVAPEAVVRTLLGTTGDLPVVGWVGEESGEFAGRADVMFSPFVALVDRVPVTDVEEVEVSLVHPAFGAWGMGVVRPAPPEVRVDVEDAFGRGVEATDRWWILGAAAAVVVLAFSGTFWDLAMSGRSLEKGGKSQVPEISPVVRQADAILEHPMMAVRP